MKQEIINYIMNSISNTNRAILKQYLNSLEESGGKENKEDSNSNNNSSNTNNNSSNNSNNNGNESNENVSHLYFNITSNSKGRVREPDAIATGYTSIDLTTLGVVTDVNGILTE